MLGSVILVYILLYQKVQTTKSFDLDPNNTKLIEQTLTSLCPKVDICDRNASSAYLRPNGKLDDSNQISCCQGCSCHPDCYSKQNCCFEEANHTVTINDTIPVCMYMRFGRAHEKWLVDVPAYYTINTEPADGCVDNQIFESVNGGRLRPSCDSKPVAQWGDFFPVLSNTPRKVYKNEACARCHGVKEISPFVPYLVCDKFNAGPRVYIDDFFEFYDSNLLSPHCSIDFEHTDILLLHTERCFINTISSCPSDEIVPILNSELSIELIKTACEEGVHAPIKIDKTAYKNMFCAHCNINRNMLSKHFCSEEDFSQKRISNRLFTAILDTKKVKSVGITQNLPNKMASLPMACLKNNFEWQDESCREVLCPSGMMRNSEGLCVFISKTMFIEGFHLLVKLKSVAKNVSNVLHDSDTVVRELARNCPWTPYWQIKSIYLKCQDGFLRTDDLFAVRLIIQRKNHTYWPNVITKIINQGLSKPWLIEVNGTIIQLVQYISEYNLLPLRNRPEVIPDWKFYLITNSIQSNYSEIDSSLWSEEYDVLQRRVRYPIIVRESFFCEQVELTTGEYTVEIDNYLIKNEVNGRLLFEREFILVEKESGNRVARVCLAKTPFVVRTSGCSIKPLFYGFTLSTLLVFAMQNI